MSRLNPTVLFLVWALGAALGGGGILPALAGIPDTGVGADPAQPTAAPHGIDLAADGSPRCVIVLPDEPIAAERTAAEELLLHVRQMSGATLPVIAEREYEGTPAVLLGQCRRALKIFDVPPDWTALGKEGCLIRTVGNSLVIAGGRPRGTLYGVYEILEKHLGCRWYAPDTSHVPKRRRIVLPELDYVYRPDFEFREPWIYGGGVYNWWFRDHHAPEYVARTRTSAMMTGVHVREIPEAWGGRVNVPHYGHNLSELVPAVRYAGEHPEYFALYEGKRLTEGDLELCMSNPEVAEVAARTLAGWMRENPQADLFHIGQSDTYRLCQCETCRAAYAKYMNPETTVGRGGSDAQRAGYTGVCNSFVNRVAAKVKQDFPDKTIGIFAYGTTMPLPRHVDLHANVVVWFAPIQRCFCHPIDKGPINTTYWRFTELLLPGWLERTRMSKLYAYEYCPLGLDWPNDILTIPDTVRVYHRAGVKGMLIDSMRDINVSFGFLRHWLWSQMLNDVAFDFERGLEDFCGAYYGKAAPFLLRFIRLAGDVEAYEPDTEERASTYFPADSQAWHTLRSECNTQYRLPKPESMEKAYILFNEALKAVRDDPRSLRHVREARIVLQLKMLYHLPPDDPRLDKELVGLVRSAREFECPRLPYRGSPTVVELIEQIRRRTGRNMENPPVVERPIDPE